MADALRAARAALARRDLPEAIRRVDHAWRTGRTDRAVLAPIYARLLALEGRSAAATLRILRRIEWPVADEAALIVHQLLRLNRPEEARLELDLALQRYALQPRDLLVALASTAMEITGVGARGWLAHGTATQFFGELATAQPLSSIEIRLNDQPVACRVRYSRGRGHTRFRFRHPAPAGSQFEVRCAGELLLGGVRRFPLDMALDGRSTAATRRVSGWVRIGCTPDRRTSLMLQDEFGHTHRIRAHALADPGGRWPFSVDLRLTRLRGNRIEISANLPDGGHLALPDSPLLLAPAVRLSARKIAPLLRWRTTRKLLRATRRLPENAPPVTVIIPVYRGRHESLACIESALATTQSLAHILVVDDATEDPLLAAALDRLAHDRRVELLRNERNLGFVRSVNRAIAHCVGRDCVLLNSDTRVFGDWLARLRATAYGAERIGSVTPLGNDASIASYPLRQGGAMEIFEAAALHRLAAWCFPGQSVETPVGVGYCLYLRRECLDEVGELDAAVFGYGYGEETDFCMRARRLRWSHRIAADVYVYHASGLSFGPRRAALLHRSQRLMALRYPGYDQLIQDFQARDPLRPVRRRLDERRLSTFDGTFVLLVSIALEGGVERYIDERSRQIRAEGKEPLVLRSSRPGDRSQCELRTAALAAPNLHYRIPAELDLLVAQLRNTRIESIEFSHFLDLDARVIEALLELGLPYDFMLHDYAWICPRITLIDESRRYCREPSVATCTRCVRRNGSRLGERIPVAALRARSARWLSGARRVLAPSTDTALRMSQYFPRLKIAVHPHRPAARPRTLPPLRPRRARIRVGVIGAIGIHKGYDVLLACARDAARRSVPLEFVVLGYTMDDARLVDSGRVFVTGRYSEREAAHLLRREQPDLLFLPSVWPETWCYALDHALDTGLPIVAFDLGAIAERLRAAATGLLLPLETRPREINDRLVSYVSDNRVF